MSGDAEWYTAWRCVCVSAHDESLFLSVVSIVSLLQSRLQIFVAQYINTMHKDAELECLDRSWACVLRSVQLFWKLTDRQIEDHFECWIAYQYQWMWCLFLHWSRVHIWSVMMQILFVMISMFNGALKYTTTCWWHYCESGTRTVFVCNHLSGQGISSLLNGLVSWWWTGVWNHQLWHLPGCKLEKVCTVYFVFGNPTCHFFFLHFLCRHHLSLPCCSVWLLCFVGSAWCKGPLSDGHSEGELLVMSWFMPPLRLRPDASFDTLRRLCASAASLPYRHEAGKANLSDEAPYSQVTFMHVSVKGHTWSRNKHLSNRAHKWKIMKINLQICMASNKQTLILSVRDSLLYPLQPGNHLNDYRWWLISRAW